VPGEQLRSAVSSPTAIAAISSSSSIASLLRSGGNRFAEARNYGNTIRGSGFRALRSWGETARKNDPLYAIGKRPARRRREGIQNAS
jgi:hypothetical protein